MSNISHLLQTAVQLHRGGQPQQARDLYLQILEQDPGQSDAWNLLSLIAWQSGQFADAVEYARRALALDSSQAAYFGNLAEGLRGLGQYAEAIDCYTRALAMQPTAVQAHINAGTLYEQAGRRNDAIASYRRALQLQPANVEAWFRLGTAFQQLDDLPSARACYERIVGQLEPDHVSALINLGGLEKAAGNLAAAARHYERAIQLDPTRAPTHFHLGVVYQLLQRWPEAIGCYRRVLELDPEDGDALCNLGNSLREHGRPAEAIEVLQRAVARQPDSPAVLNNLAVALQDLGRLDEAQRLFERAVAIEPGTALYHFNLGVVLGDQGDLEAAIERHDRALALQPGNAQARFSRAAALLALGRFAEGWPECEHRIGLPQFDTRAFPQPRWDGSRLGGRTLLIHCEQGFGDTLQFIRYVKPAIERAGDGRVTILVQQVLMPLLAASGFTGLAPNEGPLPPFDVHVPLLSLPLLFGTTLETVPCDVPYLAAEPSRIEMWRERLAAYDGLKIGIAWQGRPSFRRDLWRSIPLASFAPVAQVPRVKLFSLQKGPGVEQLAEFSGGWGIVDLASSLDLAGAAFMDTAAVMRNLDLVITSDTAVAHLAGALGVRVWVALAFSPDWRWLNRGDESPWYPTMRLFRQTRLGEWSDVFERMASAIGKLDPPSVG